MKYIRMKAILISDHPKWCALMMNGDKTVEVRKGTALYKATQKLIDEYGFAEFYVYCTKDKKHKLEYCDIDNGCWSANDGGDYYNGKVVFKFRCHKVERISWQIGLYELDQQPFSDFLDKCCLVFFELKNYLNKKDGCAIHISDLEIFDKPKELSEFEHEVKTRDTVRGYIYDVKPLTKAPQSWCYVEVEQ